jgi:hypothetical protein
MVNKGFLCKYPFSTHEKKLAAKELQGKKFSVLSFSLSTSALSQEHKLYESDYVNLY